MRAVCVAGLIVAYRAVPEFHKRRRRQYGNQDWSDHPVDCLLLAKLEEGDFHPLRPPTDTLSCECCILISTGLPPTSKEIETYVNIDSTRMYEELEQTNI